ncbi:MAG: hypothetical protein ACOY4K_06485 [Pseudomonadota bacterium]
MTTIKVKPWAEGQGEFVLIDALAFDPAIHQRLDGDDTPLPGPFDHIGRVKLIELAVTVFREQIVAASDEDLRRLLTEHRAHKAEQERVEAEQRAAVAEPIGGAPPANEQPDPLDRDGDKEPGGSLPDGYSLGADGTTVVHDLTGQTWPGADEFRAWRTERADLLSKLSLLDVAFEGHPDNATLSTLLEEARAKKGPGFLLGSSVLEAILEVGERKVQLGGLVVASQKESGLSVADWNALPEADREAKLAATLERLRADPAAAEAEIDPASVLPQEQTDETGGEVTIPEGWADLHWTQRVKLARAIAEGDYNAEAADKVITEELARRAAKSEG